MENQLVAKAEAVLQVIRDRQRSNFDKACARVILGGPAMVRIRADGGNAVAELIEPSRWMAEAQPSD